MLPPKTIKHLKKLQQKKFRNEYQEFIVEGIKIVNEALDSDFEIVLVIIQGDKREEKEFAEIIEKAESRGVMVEFTGRQDLDKIKTTDTFPGVLAVIENTDFVIEDLINDSTIICLDRINDPGNLGTIIRTADWFGIKNILLSEDSVDPTNPKVVRSTMGSLFHVNIFTSKNIKNNLVYLKDKCEYKLCSLDMKGEKLESIKNKLNKEKTIYLFGSESHGVDPKLEELIDKSYTISGSGQAESLNVAVAAGILMNHL